MNDVIELEWISVKASLPPEGALVLAGNNEDKWYQVAPFKNGKFWWSEMGGELPHVTHWMHMIEMPKSNS